jgi:single-stranded DNA-binding protein
MTFGFNVHIICGRIASIDERESGGTKVVNIRIQARNSFKREEARAGLWIDASIWGKYAEAFKSSNFRRGDKISVSISSLQQGVWMDKEGVHHASLRGNVDKFWDLRSGAERMDARLNEPIRAINRARRDRAEIIVGPKGDGMPDIPVRMPEMANPRPMGAPDDTLIIVRKPTRNKPTQEMPPAREPFEDDDSLTGDYYLPGKGLPPDDEPLPTDADLPGGDDEDDGGYRPRP